MEKLKENLNAMIVCCFELVIGILLLIEPVKFTSGIIIATGVILCVIGFIQCIKYFRTDARKAAMGQFLTKGLTALLIGCFFIFYSEWFIVTFPALTILYGVAILFSGLEKIQLCIDMLRFKRAKWYFAVISALISFVCAFIILRSPFESTEILWIFTGVSLILEGVFDIITLIINSISKSTMEVVEDVAEENAWKEDNLQEDDSAGDTLQKDTLEESELKEDIFEEVENGEVPLPKAEEDMEAESEIKTDVD